MEDSTRRLEVLSSSEEDITCRTFIFRNEDHTFGNALRYIISKNPEVDYCGYSVPHPSIHDINFRIQTKGAAATDVLKKGLEDLQTLCDHMNTTFQNALEDYRDTKKDDIERLLEEMDA
ncbi:DNA-directed RNA polymerases I and III subunit RPAC2 [Araneus ventricosus]|uniref:DNA-directed RNA polymerases I and III subunit RPAC2 n=1 Tax=Araneus ventricosus TaxID=182803 RepID=A0A4Y2FCC1_ARAVE|nr:DNA-directed RNA polymerases I and III subunit RPAC2 [Araneus ventricosus]